VATSAQADRIIYTNGNTLIGEILSLDDGILYFRSQSSEELIIDASQIKAVETDNQVRIVFTNNDTLTGKINITETQRLSIETKRFGTLEDISLAEIKSLAVVDHVQPHDSAPQTTATLSALPDEADKPLAEVTLISGERLHGEIKGIDENNLILATEFSKDDLKISRDKIASIKSDHPLAVFFDEEDYFKGEIKPADDNRLIVENTESGTKREFELSEVQDLYDGDPQQKIIDEQKYKFSGNINIGMEFESGNTDEDTVAFVASFRARNPTERYTVRFNKLYEKTNGEKTEDEFLLFTKYDHFFDGKWFAYAGGVFEQDRIDFLKLRTTLSAGLGYQFFETDDHFLSVDGGPAWVDEKFLEGEEDEDDTNFWALKLGIDYEYQLFEWSRFFHFSDALVGVEDLDDSLITSQTGFRMPITDKFNATVQANIDWEKSPPPGVATTDKEYLITLGYEF
jgi:putative salt-induced outer membrane protein YdiY